jgi:hypothetical protein
MKSWLFAVLIISSLIFVIGASGCSNQNSAQTPANGAASADSNVSAVQKEVVDPNKMVDCGEIKDPNCFINRMSQCLPVTATMTGSDGSTKIELIILGVENGTCHFQRTVSSNNALNLDCHFPKGTMNWDTIDQTFGNDKGLQKVVDDACKPTGW